MQVEYHSQIQPTLTGPDVADIARLLPGNGLPANHERAFLVRPSRTEVTVQQVRCDVERVIAIRRRFEFACSFNNDPVLAHQTPHTSMPDIDADLLQLFGHSRAAPYGECAHSPTGQRIAAEAQA